MPTTGLGSGSTAFGVCCARVHYLAERSAARELERRELEGNACERQTLRSFSSASASASASSGGFGSASIRELHDNRTNETRTASAATVRAFFMCTDALNCTVHMAEF